MFHVIPEAAVPDADRYRGTVEDETRLFYVAVTRAQKYLYLSFSPGVEPAVYRSRRSSSTFATQEQYFLTTEPDGALPDRLEPRAGTRRRMSRSASAN